MKKLTFFINPFASKESKKIELMRDHPHWKTVLKYRAYDYVDYFAEGDKGRFYVDDFSLFEKPNQRTYAFSCKGGKYHYILGDKSVFTVETNKSPKEMLNTLRELILFFDNDSLNQRMLNHVLIHNTNIAVI
jgi:hypothetical protein